MNRLGRGDALGPATTQDGLGARQPAAGLLQHGFGRQRMPAFQVFDAPELKVEIGCAGVVEDQPQGDLMRRLLKTIERATGLAPIGAGGDGVVDQQLGPQ